MTTKTTRILAVMAGAAIATGCSSMAAESSSTAIDGEMVSAAELRASQQRVTELESALAAKDRDLTNAQGRLSSTSDANMAAGDVSLFPPNPKPGQCYARVLIPATYTTTSEQQLKREAAERIEIVPARYETAQETILVKEAAKKLEVVPAVYGSVEERVLVKPASKKIVEVPAVYETVAERVVDKPAHTAWKKGPASAHSSTVLTQSTTDTGEIMCLVEVPATYKTIEKRVLVSAAKTETVEIPAEYKTITKTVVTSPATTREVEIPAKYDTVTVTRLVSPASERRIAIPAEYQTVSKTSKTSDESMEWRQVVCEINLTRDNVVALQQALADEGYYKAGIDGIIGTQTLSAARSYALARDLPAGSNYVPMEVVSSLGLNL